MSKYDQDTFEKDSDEYEAPVRRSRYEEDDDDEVPTRRRAETSVDEEDDEKPSPRVIKRGWGAAERIKDADSPFAQRLKITEDPQVIKFLEDEPYASFRMHWVERQGQKSFTCISDIDERGCPLCEVGNRPSTRFAFNVALVTDGDAVVKSYEVGPRVIDQLKNFHTDALQGPLTKNYWAVSRTGKGASSATNHQMIKERDLEDDWRVNGLGESELKALRKACYTPEIIQIPKRKDLLSIADEES